MKIPGLLGLREVPAEVLVNNFEARTTELFETATRLETPDVVVIPACNEEQDIAATLLSLSRSERPVVPIVVENGSREKDRTYEYACRMGAVVLQCAPAKMRATQVGLAMSRELFPAQPVIHFGDADNLYPVATVPAISKATQRTNESNGGNGALQFGLGVYDHGSSPVVDVMRSGRLIRKAVQRKIKGETPMPYGFNYALHVDSDETIIDAMNAIDPLLFVREESEICKAALQSGLAIDQLVSLSAFVFTRSDLIKSRAEWNEFKGASMDTKTKYYKRNYPDVDFLPNSEGR
ncbi:MAG: hypothetical protein UY35_C0019G0005 [Candidatus Saccharibacteria bacterium GW2011_GWC2_48_9]|nr:MAG: hypothetical protein UY35_C0019G0005 [Candidatus Saccharibacteria bacterium GW2011_GWC2_48_9]HCH33960.1 hypothetical protein [Candidatus Saccharibacteria bacterium]